MRVACAIVCLWLVGPAEATTLYRCVAADGMVSYQDAPCDGGSTESRRIAVRSESEPEARPAGAKPAKAPKRSKDATRSKGSRSDSRSQSRLACTRAREERDVALVRAGLRRTFEQLRALDDRVYQACKGL